MGTRAIIEIYDEHGVLLLIIYSQYDGHLSSLGKVAPPPTARLCIASLGAPAKP